MRHPVTYFSSFVSDILLAHDGLCRNSVEPLWKEIYLPARWPVDDFVARSPDELSLTKGDRIELIERDDDFGDGWYLGKHLQNGNTGLFPEGRSPHSGYGAANMADYIVYTTTAPKPTLTPSYYQTKPSPTAPPYRDGSAHQAGYHRAESSTTSIPQPQLYGQSSRPDGPSRNATAKYQEPPSSTYTPPLSASGHSENTTPRASFPQTALERPRLQTGARAEDSPVMNETLNVIDEHITGMSNPRPGLSPEYTRRGTIDSSSDYSGSVHRRLSDINGSEPEGDQVANWSPQRVADHLESVGVESRHCQVFLEQEISGDILLDMDQSSLMLKEFDLGPVGRRLKTWHKIKALQMEVMSNQGGLKAQPHEAEFPSAPEDQTLQTRSIDRQMTNDIPPQVASGGLPHVHTLANDHQRASTMTMTSNPFSSRQRASTMTYTLGNDYSPAPSIYQANDPPRPSAASVRSLNHSRRHSSMDVGNGFQRSNNFTAPTSPAHSRQSSHVKQYSFDRAWSLTPQATRPQSAFHGHSQSLDRMSQHDTREHRRSLTMESNRLSAGPDTTQKNGRTVLQKKSVFQQNGPVLASSSKPRPVSTEATTDSAGPNKSFASKIFGSGSFNKSSRAVSGPELSKPMVAHDEPPIVTKLEYNENHSPGAGTPNSGSGKSPATTHGSNPFGKRVAGLRAISDSATGSDAPPPDMLKDSPQSSSTRTGSSTPSLNSKSFDLEKDETSKSSNSGSANFNKTMTPIVTARVAKASKKTTSAYTRGLERKSPQEQMRGCDFSGWMKKKSSTLMTTWKPRFFILRGRRLSYYYSMNDTSEQGVVDISAHRVLPAHEERITGLHAVITGAKNATPASQPTKTSASTKPPSNHNIVSDVGKNSPFADSFQGIFIFKLVPPRNGLSRAVHFTKPAVHYFAVDNIAIGRLWMAALMRATIERDLTTAVTTTYQQKTISLKKAAEMRQRPPALMEEDAAVGNGSRNGENGADDGNRTPILPTITEGLGLSLRETQISGSQAPPGTPTPDPLRGPDGSSFGTLSGPPPHQS